MAEITDAAILAQLNGGGASARQPTRSIQTAPSMTPAERMAIERQAAADARANAAAERAARADERAAAKMDEPPAGYQWAAGPNGKRELQFIPGGPADPAAQKQQGEAATQAKAKIANLDSLVQQINRVQSLYENGPGATSGISGIADFIPTPANRQFNTAAAGLAEQGLAAFRVPGAGSQSDTELRQFVEANRPSASDYDTSIEEKLRQLRVRADAARSGAGLPPAEWAGPAINVDKRNAPPAIGGGTPPAPPSSPGGGMDRSAAPDLSMFGDTTGAGGTPTLARPGTGGKSVPAFPGLNDQIAQMVRRGASTSDIAAAMRAMGNVPDSATINAIQKNVDAVKRGYTGPLSIDAERKIVPENGYQEFMNPIAQSPTGTGIAQYANFMGAGLPQLVAGNEGFDALDALNPKASATGKIVGAIGGAYGAGSALKGMFGAGTKMAAAAPAIGDIGYSALTGATTAKPGERGTGALIGGLAGLVGEGIGRKVLAPGINVAMGTRPVQSTLNAIRSATGRAPMAPHVPTPDAATQLIYRAVGDQGPDVMRQLQDAADLGLPFTLADTHPSLRSLAGASVRRSPDVRGIADANLIPRGRGQYDRLTSAMDRDFGPAANIPAHSEALIKQARDAAKPLYDEAYAAQPMGSPTIDTLFATPSGRSAVSRAETIAANNRVDPRAIGFSRDANGEVLLNPVATSGEARVATARQAVDAADANLARTRNRVSGGGGGDMPGATASAAAARRELADAETALAQMPSPGAPREGPVYSPQSVDYVKRGLDDQLEGYRNPITGKLNLDEMGRSIEGVRADLVREADALNPAFGRARAAYAGPAGEREAFFMGKDALTQSPDVIANVRQGLTPTRQEQHALGFRSGLQDQAGRTRLAANPWEAAYGSPHAQSRASLMFPEGAPNFSRQYDLEGRMAQTQNNVLGNSSTAERALADQEFGLSPGAGLAIDAIAAGATGAPAGATLMSLLGKAGGNIKDVAKIGFGKRKANALGPILLDTNAAEAAARFAAQADAARAYEAQMRRARNVGGMFGAGAVAPLYSDQ